MPFSHDALTACRECDLLHRRQRLARGETARCVRCNAVLYRHTRHGREQSAALLCAALLLFVSVNAFPFLSIQVQGQSREITLISCIKELYHQGMSGLALFVFAILLLAPLLRMLGLLYVLLPRRGAYWTLVWRGVTWLEPWSMMEIYLLGALVAVVKLTDMGAVIPGAAFWSFMALVFVMTWAGSALNREALWRESES